MSAQYPIVAVTGSSGAGSPIFTSAIRQMLERLKAAYIIIDGEGFHRYERHDFPHAVEKAKTLGRKLSHFSPDANLLDMLESLLREFSEKGRGMHRRYVHDSEDAAHTHCPVGTFTPWEIIPEHTDILIYEGLHGCYVSDTVDIAHYMDFKVGVVPILNLEWMQKIYRDTRLRGYSIEAVTDMVERRMNDYVHYITPQFSRTDVNFQRIPMVDTSNPFEPQDLPTLTESYVIIHFQAKTLPYTLPQLLNRIPHAFVSRQKNLVIPGEAFALGVQLVLEPFIEHLLNRKRFGMS